MPIRVRLLALLALVLLFSGCNSGSTEPQATRAKLSGRNATTATANYCWNNPPDQPWCSRALSAQKRTQLLLDHMTLSQKIGLLAGDEFEKMLSSIPYHGIVHGIPSLGIPALRMSDGPLGVGGGPATAFPIPLGQAATFNPDLAYRIGAAVAGEVRHRGNNLIHAPVADLVRNPLAGRVFETFGEDPYLVSQMVVEWIRGVQSRGVLADVKHFAAYVQEGMIGLPPLTGLISGRHLYNARVSQRVLRELYLRPFEAAVKKANVATVMCAYNYINGQPACGNEHLLQHILREQWGFDGFVVSDYILAVKGTASALNGGTDIEMPVGVFYNKPAVRLAVTTGTVSKQVINTRVGNILRTMFKFGFFDHPPYERNLALIDKAAHEALAREVAEQSIVLLVNDGTLPISSDVQRIAVIGKPATERPSGGGSSFVTPYHFHSSLDAICQRAGPGVKVIYNDGSNRAAAAALAARVDIALVFVTDKTTEGLDRYCLQLDCRISDIADPLVRALTNSNLAVLPNKLLEPILAKTPISDVLKQVFSQSILMGSPLQPASYKNQDALIKAVAAAQPDTVVVMQTAGPVLTPWRDQIAALLEAWYPGQEAGIAIAHVLFGDTDPGGRLPVTFPASEMDTPVAGHLKRYPGLANQVYFSEGVFIGYRWFDKHNIEPAFPFGYGLSYTTMALSNLHAHATRSGNVIVDGTITNTGDRAGWGVPQLYASLPEPSPDVPQPPVVLKGFAKYWLQPGESQALHFELSPRELSYWDVDTDSWRLAPGCYGFSLGLSSRNRPLKERLPLAGGQCG